MLFFLVQVEELKSRLTEAENHTTGTDIKTNHSHSNGSNGVNGSPPALPVKPTQRVEIRKTENVGTQKKGPAPTTGVIVRFKFRSVLFLRFVFDDDDDDV